MSSDPRPRRRRFQLTFPDGGVMELGARTRVMGVLNVTPDSFSDGGRFLEPGRAVDAALAMVDAGADLVDLGGESTRPGAAPVDAGEELRRILPVLRRLRRESPVRVSVDTMKAAVAERALDEGADMVNDVSALADPAMAEVAARRGAPVVLMHMRGTPRTMQRNTRYENLWNEILDALRRADTRAQEAGLASDKILLDPGIGFGKSLEGNLKLLRELPRLAALGRPILVGASRKSFLGRILDLPVDERLEGSLAAAVIAAWQGAHVVRVHDVQATVRALRVADAVASATPEP